MPGRSDFILLLVLIRNPNKDLSFITFKSVWFRTKPACSAGGRGDEGNWIAWHLASISGIKQGNPVWQCRHQGALQYPGGSIHIKAYVNGSLQRHIVHSLSKNGTTLALRHWKKFHHRKGQGGPQLTFRLSALFRFYVYDLKTLGFCDYNFLT